jgi:hypothetical protein
MRAVLMMVTKILQEQSTLQHDEWLTQSEILEKETLPPAKEADRHAEAEPDEAHHGQDL